MAFKIEDVLESSFVLLGMRVLSTPAERAAFINRCDTEVTSETGIGIAAAGTSGTQENVHILKLNRDRISLEISPARCTIKREYPSKIDLQRLAEICYLSIANSDSNDSTPDAFGYNIILLYTPTSGVPASAYLGERIFARALMQDDEIELLPSSEIVGGMGQVTFDIQGTRWNLTVEPRFKDLNTTTIYLNLNYHFSEKRLPGHDEISESLRKTWNQAYGIIEAIDAIPSIMDS